jgi:hypothetical protein
MGFLNIEGAYFVCFGRRNVGVGGETDGKRNCQK